MERPRTHRHRYPRAAPDGGEGNPRGISPPDPRREAAIRILRLEERNSFNDRAVVGGLEAFAGAWLRDQQRGAAPQSELAAELSRLLAGYSELPIGQRAERVRQAVALMEHAAAKERAGGRARESEIGRAGDGGMGRLSPRSIAPSRDSPIGERPVASSQNAVPPRDTPVDKVKGIGPTRAKLLARLGVTRVDDFLTHYPLRHEAYPPPQKARDLFFQRVASFVGTLRDVNVAPTARGVKKITATLCDDTGCVSAVWFRGKYGDISVRPGQQVAVSGPIASYGRQLQFENPEWEPAESEPIHTRRMVPVYPLTKGVSERWLRTHIKQVVDRWARSIVDPLPRWILEEHDLLPLAEAIRQIHFPESAEHLEHARRRLAFNEMFYIQLVVLQRRARWRGPGGTTLPAPRRLLSAFQANVPFTLTAAQERVLREVLRDLEQSVPMTRLLQGEVGSGKTVVAAASLLAAAAHRTQGALMAPTEILAEQHFRTLSDLYDRANSSVEPLLGHGMRVALLTGSTRAAERERVLARVTEGSIDVLVGTHALIQEAVEFSRLALVIVDEQHRFGVRQRVQLRQKGQHPHMLVMTATPIPRTLAMTLYGDLDVSTIDEMPPGRQPIETRLLEPSERHWAYRRIREEVRQGRQAFVICPLVEDSPTLEVRAATEEYERLRTRELCDLRLALVHGRMRPQQKETTMRAFRDGEYDVLVSTAVVEVGVDIPNATVMLIEGAERFGLSQLHQFRGRVGRGSQPAICLLQTDQEGQDVRERLKVLEQSSNGLNLAEQDLEMRGPGDFFGVRQSGFPDLRMARLTDLELVEVSRNAARRLLEHDPELSKPDHARLLEQVEQLIARSSEST